MRHCYVSIPGRLSHAAATAVSLLLLVPALVAAAPCTVPTSGGTVNLPPAGCPYLSPTDVHMIINGLPAGTTINVGIEHREFFNVTSTPGGSFPGGDKETFGSNLVLTMDGTGTLTGFHRVINMPAQCESHTAPRGLTPPNTQSFDTRMHMIQGQITGDPDFDLLRITAGNGFGMPSPGHTTLTYMSGGNWNVDSFFDITYRIDFVGHPGSILGGHSGSTTGTIRMATGQPATPPPGPCALPANPSGTVDLPPAGCTGYVSPADLHMMINGLPPGTQVNIAAKHAGFFNVIRGGDGAGGENEQYGAGLQLQMTGTGTLIGFTKNVTMQTQCQTHTNPRNTSAASPNAIQSFDTEMMGIQGQITGDPDFDLLRITAGSGFGLPSPGHTTLTGIPGSEPGSAAKAGNLSAASVGSYNVDSFFDITYRIDFVGHSPGPFGGMSGSTTGTIRMEAGQPTLVSVPRDQGQSEKIELTNSPNPASPGTVLQYRLPATATVKLSVFDAAGRVVRHLTDEVVPAGPHAMMWDARDDAGRTMGPGTYFVKLEVNGRAVASRKVSILR